MGKGNKKNCPSCRHDFGLKFIANPRINTALTFAIRAFKSGPSGPAKPFVRINNDDRPDEAFTTERAQRAGMANAASGRIMVNVPGDHFGPIPASADPRGTGVRVGEWWRDRLHCRQWGAHFPHVAGIAGQSGVGAQSVVLSGGYEDDRDEGEWFLYTGSGGRDLSGNKRTNKKQSFDQKFESMNLALKESCMKGLPVRVVRSYKEKRSSYAPPDDTPVRYDGIYRIAKCWRKKGEQGFLVCRYLFVRCDNEPAPWSSDESGDKPIDLERDLPKEALQDMKAADNGQVFSMKTNPWWDYDSEKKEWGWTRPPPVSQKTGAGGTASGRARKKLSEQEKALRELSCMLCKNVLSQPMTAPCTHTFCKACLDAKFGATQFEYDAGLTSGRSMRVRKVTVQCPCSGCTTDLAEFLRNGQINRDMEALIAKLQKEVEAARKEAAEESREGGAAETGAEGGPSSQTPAAKKRKGANGAAAAVAEASPAPAPAPEAAPSVPRREQQTEASKQAAAIEELSSQFPTFDAQLVQELLEQEEGDVRAVRAALSKMHHSMEAEKKKMAKLAKQAAAAEAHGTANGAANGTS